MESKNHSLQETKTDVSESDLPQGPELDALKAQNKALENSFETAKTHSNYYACKLDSQCGHNFLCCYEGECTLSLICMAVYDLPVIIFTIIAIVIGLIVMVLGVLIAKSIFMAKVAKYKKENIVSEPP